MDIEFNLQAIERQRRVDIGGIRMAMEAKRAVSKLDRARTCAGPGAPRTRAFSELASFSDAIWARPEAPARRRTA